jgi:hypothetical protein
MRLAVILAFLVLGVLSPALAAPRTGTICIHPVTINEYSTSDPVEITPDVVAKASQQIKKAVEIEIANESKMTVTKDCTAADFLLNIRLTKVDTIIQRLLFGKTERRFSFATEGNLVSSGTGKIVVAFDKDTGLDEYEYSVNDIAEEIVDEVK